MGPVEALKQGLKPVLKPKVERQGQPILFARFVPRGNSRLDLIDVPATIWVPRWVCYLRGSNRKTGNFERLLATLGVFFQPIIPDAVTVAAPGGAIRTVAIRDGAFVPRPLS
jgi:hypothetical protein